MAAGGGPVMAAGRGGRRRREELQRGFIEQRGGAGPRQGERPQLEGKGGEVKAGRERFVLGQFWLFLAFRLALGFLGRKSSNLGILLFLLYSAAA